MNGRLPLYLLFGGCALFAGLLFLEATAPEATDQQAIEAAPRQAAPAPTPLRPAEENVEALLGATLARPLFNPTRRPSAKSDEPGAAAGLGDSRLTGIVTVPNHRTAIFAVPGAKPLVVSEGDNVSGWRIDAISPEEVALTGPDGSKTLRPKSDPNLAPPAPPIVPAVAGAAPGRPVPATQMPRPLNPVPPGIRPSLPNAPPGLRPLQR